MDDSFNGYNCNIKRLLNELKTQFRDIKSGIFKEYDHESTKKLIKKTEVFLSSLYVTELIVDKVKDLIKPFENKGKVMLSHLKNMKRIRCVSCRKENGTLLPCNHSLCIGCINSSYSRYKENRNCQNGTNDDKSHIFVYDKKCPKCKSRFEIKCPIKKKIRRSNGAIVWTFFDKNNNGFNVCKLCNANLSVKTSTYSLRNHIKVKHIEEYTKHFECEE